MLTEVNNNLTTINIYNVPETSMSNQCFYTTQHNLNNLVKIPFKDT